MIDDVNIVHLVIGSGFMLLFIGGVLTTIVDLVDAILAPRRAAKDARIEAELAEWAANRTPADIQRSWDDARAS